MLFYACSGNDASSNKTRAGIIAEQMVKADVISADDFDFDLVGVDEGSINEYHVVANIKTLNGLGLKVPRKVSVRLRYNGTGDWSDINNWSKKSIIYLDEATGRTQSSVAEKTFETKASVNPYANLNGGDKITVSDVAFTVVSSDEKNLLISSETRLTPEQIKDVCNELDSVDYIAFFFVGQTPGKDDPYSMKMGEIVFYGDDVI